MKRFCKSYGRVLGFLRPHWRMAVLLCAANVALAGAGFVEPVLFGRIVEGLGGSGVTGLSVLAWAGLGVTGIVAGMATSLAADRLAHRLKLRVMGQAYAHVLTLPPAYYAQHPTSGLTKVMMEGTGELFWMWLGLFREHLATALCILGILPAAIIMNPALGAVLVVLMLLFVALVSYTVRRTEKGQRRAEDAHIAMTDQIGDVLANAALVRAFDRGEREAQDFGRLAGNVVRHQFPVLGWWASVSVLSRAASTAATVSVVALGAWLHGKGQATTGDVVAFIGFAGMLIGRLEGAMWTIARLGGTLPKLEDFFALMDARSAVPDPVGQPELPAGPGEVEFRDVRFAYPGGPAILDGISFAARPGETVALVGATGSGKSTAMALLQRLWDPAEGSVLVDGHDLRSVKLSSLRDRIGTVPQETLLLNRSILENLRVGKPDATREEVEHAARLAEAHDFILRQPKGYDTVVGERGAALSGGQRQRLAIARALLRDPRILVLDEATSALDGGTEEKVVRAMKAAAAGRTTFVIAHRLATVRDAHRILFFRDGKVAESGTFEELVALGGGFAELARTQFLLPPPAEADAAEPARVPYLTLVYSRPAEMDPAAVFDGAKDDVQVERALNALAG